MRSFVDMVFNRKQNAEHVQEEGIKIDTYRSPAPISSSLEDSGSDINKKSTTKNSEEFPLFNQYASLPYDGVDHKYDVKSRDVEVGIIIAEVETSNDGNGYACPVLRKKFVGTGPSQHESLQDKNFPGVIIYNERLRGSASPTIEPLMMVKFARDMYENWLKKSIERGFYEFDSERTQAVFDPDLGEENVLKRIEIPANRVTRITVYTKSHIVTWKEKMIKERMASR